MKITVLDTNTVSGGELDLSPIESFGQTEYFDLLSEDEIIKAARDSEVIICNKSQITDRIMEHCKALKFITLFATGYNNIDISAASRRGITVSNAPGYSTASVAQHTFALMLELCENLSKYTHSVKAGDWVKSKNFCYFSYPLSELNGKTLGIIGFGTIGAEVAKIAKAFSMQVVANARTPKNFEGVEFLPKDEIFKQSDFLTLHCPLTAETRSLVCEKTLKLMKPSAFIINTSRGAVVHENDLCTALKNGTIAGAALDVLDSEPMYENHPYLTAPNLIMTPHIAWATIEARRRLLTLVAQNIGAYVSGSPINAVNKL